MAYHLLDVMCSAPTMYVLRSDYSVLPTSKNPCVIDDVPRIWLS